MCLNTWPIGSGTVRCGLIGSVSLWRRVLRFYVLKLCPARHSVWLLVDHDVELSALSPAVHLPARTVIVMVSLPSNKTLTKTLFKPSYQSLVFEIIIIIIIIKSLSFLASLKLQQFSWFAF